MGDDREADGQPRHPSDKSSRLDQGEQARIGPLVVPVKGAAHVVGRLHTETPSLCADGVDGPTDLQFTRLRAPNPPFLPRANHTEGAPGTAHHRPPRCRRYNTHTDLNAISTMLYQKTLVWIDSQPLIKYRSPSLFCTRAMRGAHPSPCLASDGNQTRGLQPIKLLL